MKKLPIILFLLIISLGSFAEIVSAQSSNEVSFGATVYANGRLVSASGMHTPLPGNLGTNVPPVRLQVFGSRMSEDACQASARAPTAKTASASPPTLVRSIVSPRNATARTAVSTKLSWTTG